MTRKHFVLAMASSPPVPLEEKSHVQNHKETRKQDRIKGDMNPKEMFRFAQHDKIPSVIASEAKQSNGIESSMILASRTG